MMIDPVQIARHAAGIVGDPPRGNPAAMHANASMYRQSAQRILVQRAGIDSAQSQLQFEGPAATQFAERMNSFLQALHSQAMGLIDLAKYLDDAANQLAGAQRAHARSLERAKSNLLNQALRAANLIK